MRPAWLAIAAALAAPAAQAAEHPAAWSRPTEPFRLFGNLYYVGTEGISVFLLTGPAGHVVIGGAMPTSGPLIVASIRKLGFEPRDVKRILINHAHYDHTGGLAALKAATGAQLAASGADKPHLEAGRTIGRPELDTFPAVKVDRVVRDGETVRVGPVALTAMLTPGHTAGATSWTTTVAGRTVIFASSLTVAGQKLAGDPTYPTAAADFRRTFARLRQVKADVFLNFHAEGFGLGPKLARQRAGDASAFIDPTELARQVDAAERSFEAELGRQPPP